MDFLSLSHSDRVWGALASHRRPRRTKAIADPEPAKSASARHKKTPPIRTLVQWSYRSQASYTHLE